jgi:hypothetical protein
VDEQEVRGRKTDRSVQKMVRIEEEGCGKNSADVIVRSCQFKDVVPVYGFLKP